MKQGFQETYDGGTFFDSYLEEIHVDETPVRMHIFDTSGNPSLQSSRHQWCQQGMAFIIVFSQASKTTFDHVGQFKEEISRVHPEGCPIALVGTKADLRQREVSAEEVSQMADDLGAQYFNTSANDYEAAIRPFEYLARRHVRHRMDATMTRLCRGLWLLFSGCISQRKP